uniref:C-type lectin domain-containing protein n=1 Tax=Anopheles funestus TaxID=62324 RepID=A0A4Y0BDD2_ANOFN
MKTCVIAFVIVVLVGVGFQATHALRYTVHNTPVTFFEAWQQCIAMGGTLPSIQTPYQNRKIHAAIKKTGVYSQWWLSGVDLGMEGSWVWLSTNKPVGSPFGFINFSLGEPNNIAGSEHCLAMDLGGKWFDQWCNMTCFFVCEYKS